MMALQVRMKTVLAALLLGAAAVQAAPPALVQSADESAALPGGTWLALDGQALRLVDAQGRERASLALRGKHLDWRAAPGGAVAALLDADTQRTRLVAVDTERMSLTAAGEVPAPEHAVETLCLFRDPQGLLQVFLVGDEGFAEQWLLRGEAPPLRLRRLALPAGTEHCRVDDTRQLLYASEAAVGVWAYRADAEASGERRPLALRKPWGRLQGEAGPLTLRPDGVAVRDGSGRVHKLRVPAVAPPLPVVLARAQTDTVARFGDAADDPAIWIHPADATRSRVLGTNKKQGLLVYDLQGRQRQLLEVGRLNNVDVRQRVRFGERVLDVAVATQRDDNSVVVFLIDADGSVSEHSRIATGLDEVYGVCLYQPRAGGLDVFVNDKDGRFLRLRLDGSGERVTGRVVQRFAVASQPEGCVADDAHDRLFVGEEKRGVWTMPLATGDAALKLVLPVGRLLHADVEGLALYQRPQGSYLVVSSQGNDSYLVLDAAPPFALRGAFRIGVNSAAAIDGTSETDGLDVASAPLGPGFERGLLVVQDGHKRLPDGPQNFKYVAWDDVARALGLP